MKRSLKKFVAFVVFIALCLQVAGAAEITAYAANTSDFVIDEYGYITAYTGKASNVTLPSSEAKFVSMVDYEGTMSQIKKITVSEGIESVWIASLTNLEELTLPGTVKYLDLSDLPKLKKLNIPAECETVYLYNLGVESIQFLGSGDGYSVISVSYSDGLKELNVPEGYSMVYAVSCKALNSISVPDSARTLYYESLPTLKIANVPVSVGYYQFINVPFEALKSESESVNVYEGCIYDEYDNLVCIDTSKEVINIKKGVKEIPYLGLTYSSYVTEINLPDTVERIGYNAFEGGEKLKKINIPKSVLTIDAYAFNGTAIESLTIPKNTYLADDALYGYNGKLSVNSGNENLFVENDAVYRVLYVDEETGARQLQLVYYPKNKKTVKINGDCVSTDYGVFVGSSIKTLDIPDGFYGIFMNLLDSKIETINIPGSVGYVDCDGLRVGRCLKKINVDKSNPYYTSYKNCLYTDDLSTLLVVPFALTSVSIHKSCLSAGNYVLSNWIYDGYPEHKLTVSFPQNFATIGYYSIDEMLVYADSPMAEIVAWDNSVRQDIMNYWGIDDMELQDYRFLDSNSDILKMIYVVDAVSVKKGKSVSPDVLLPAGLNQVTKLKKNNNTEVVIKFSSSDKKVAKVDSATGVIKGVKKGTCTVNVKCTLTDGTKKSSKTFKIKVKVK